MSLTQEDSERSPPMIRNSHLTSFAIRSNFNIPISYTYLIESRYNPYTFIFVVLYNEFKFFFNLYFLLVALSQFIPQLQIGALNLLFSLITFIITLSRSSRGLLIASHYPYVPASSSLIHFYLTFLSCQVSRNQPP